MCRHIFHGLPTQDPQFVDIKRSINQNFSGKFNLFAYKILAMVFNSLEEILFSNTDTSTSKGADFYFDLNVYVETGTYFLSDRAAMRTIPVSDIELFRKFLPSTKDSVIFNFYQANIYALGRVLFLQWNGLFHGEWRGRFES